MKSSRSKFESSVQLGLLVIIFVLLLLDVSGNYVIHRARLTERDAVSSRLNLAAFATLRHIMDAGGVDLSAEASAKLCSEYRLAYLAYIPGLPEDDSKETRRDWLRSRIGRMPDPAPSGVIDVVAREPFRELVAGPDRQYHMLYPGEIGPGRGMVLVSAEEPGLAYLDTAGQIVMIASLLAAVIIIGVYVLLSRYIFRPFTAIKEEARHAGRLVGHEDDEVEAIIADYRQMIEELRDKEAELLQLNREIQNKADSLEQFNQYLLHSMSSGIMTIDRASLLVSINQAAEQILAIKSSEYLGRHYWDLFRTNVDIVNALSRALECSTNHPYAEVAYETVGGKTLLLGIIVSFIADNRGRPVGASILINDLTELSSLRLELEDRKRLAALGEMAGGLAHQLRNSIGAILGYGRLIQRRMTRAGLDTAPVASLTDEIGEAEVLIERFLYLTKPFNYQPESTSLRRLLTELSKLLRVRSDFRLIELVECIELDNPILADPLLLKQALLNLIENAANAYDGIAGTVEIHARQTGDETEIAIVDFGCGIPETERDKIFTPFYSSRPAGTGLGLPLVAKIVQLHGGHLAVDSEEGRGTVFRITLPSVVSKHVTANTVDERCS